MYIAIQSLEVVFLKLAHESSILGDTDEKDEKVHSYLEVLAHMAYVYLV